MKNFIKNITLLVVVLVLSYFTSMQFGFWYSDLTGGLGGTWIGAKGTWESIIGFPFAYIFFLILLFKLFALGNKNKWLIWLLVPALLFFGSGDLKHIYLPILLGLISFGLAQIINIVVAKFKTN